MFSIQIVTSLSSLFLFRPDRNLLDFYCWKTIYINYIFVGLRRNYTFWNCVRLIPSTKRSWQFIAYSCHHFILKFQIEQQIFQPGLHLTQLNLRYLNTSKNKKIFVYGLRNCWMFTGFTFRKLVWNKIWF